MKLIRENIIFEKFVKDSDSIADMGIGISKIIEKSFQKIYEYDKGNIYLYDMHTKILRPVLYGISIQNIYVSINYVKKFKIFNIYFYSNKYYDKNGVEINKRQYATELLEKAEIKNCMNLKKTRVGPKGVSSDGTYSPWQIQFIIKPEYEKYFKITQKEV